MELHPRSNLHILEVLVDCLPHVVYIISTVSILHHLHREMYFLVERVSMIKGIVFWDVVIDFNSKSYSRLIGPTARNVLDRITTASHHDSRKCVFKHKVETPSVPFHTHVELSELVMAQAVRPELHYKCVRPVFGHHSRHHILKKVIEIVV